MDSVVVSNDPPNAVDDSAVTDENVPINIDVLNNDTDPNDDNLTVQSVSQAANGAVSINGNGTVRYAPDAGFSGTDTFTYVATDGSLTDSATVTITVNPTGGGDVEIGYSGIAIDVTHQWKTINLPQSFNNPVVVAGGSTRDGGHQGVVRVRNVTSDSFQIRFQEWDYRDGNHTTENIGYLVVEAGVHTLTDGTQLVAGNTTLTNESFKTVSFGSNFGAAPLVIGQIVTNNDGAAVAERIRNIGTGSFQVQMQEEEISDGVHGTETLAYIAIDQGSAQSGDTTLNAVTTGNTVTHRNTTVNFGNIGGATAPVILSDMQTRDGGDAATLRHRSQTSTSVTVWVEEEASRDSELNHTTEVAGVLAMEPGTLVAGNPLTATTRGNLNGTLVTPSDIDSLFDDAINYWRSEGYQTQAFDSVEFVITDLKNQTIGLQAGSTIYIDINAAGNGWYVDSNPLTSESFEGIDLFTTITHELGHVLGLQDVYNNHRSGDIMFAYLENGARHTDPLRPLRLDMAFENFDENKSEFPFQ